ncbi:MAG: hypothetical protein IJ068_02335 [Bacilli bacterium]|nr:hypothetical protein [Bacilli bacterium]
MKRITKNILLIIVLLIIIILISLTVKNEISRINTEIQINNTETNNNNTSDFEIYPNCKDLFKIKNFSLAGNVTLGIECLSFSIILIYLFISKFNKLLFKECISCSTKLIVYVIICFLITFLLFFSITYITRLSFPTSESSNCVTFIE